MNKYAQATRLLAIIQRAGARHSAADTSIVQQIHDLAHELGATCPNEGEGMYIHPQLKAAVEALILRHPGHANQKTHGNRFGSTQAAKESLRRLKDDKVSREKYKATARKKLGLEAKPERKPGKEPIAQTVEKLKKIGGKEWQKEGKHRVYFNDLTGLYGLETSHYKTGNIMSARLGGKPISNTSAKKIGSRLAGASLYFDVAEGKYKGKGFFGNDFETIVDEIKRRKQAPG